MPYCRVDPLVPRIVCGKQDTPAKKWDRPWRRRRHRSERHHCRRRRGHRRCRLLRCLRRRITLPTCRRSGSRPLQLLRSTETPAQRCRRSACVHGRPQPTERDCCDHGRHRNRDRRDIPLQSNKPGQGRVRGSDELHKLPSASEHCDLIDPADRKLSSLPTSPGGKLDQ